MYDLENTRLFLAHLCSHVVSLPFSNSYSELWVTLIEVWIWWYYMYILEAHPEFYCFYPNISQSFARKTPTLEKTLTFNLGKSKFYLKGSHRKPKTSPFKSQKFPWRGVFLANDCDFKSDLTVITRWLLRQWEVKQKMETFLLPWYLIKNYIEYIIN